MDEKQVIDDMNHEDWVHKPQLTDLGIVCATASGIPEPALLPNQFSSRTETIFRSTVECRAELL